MVLDECV
jgi:hypothetical protein